LSDALRDPLLLERQQAFLSATLLAEGVVEPTLIVAIDNEREGDLEVWKIYCIRSRGGVLTRWCVWVAGPWHGRPPPGVGLGWAFPLTGDADRPAA
jgi:hypothetical protein